MDKLDERAQALRRRLLEYESLLNSKLDDPTTVYLGDNYFASIPLADSKAFLTRRIESLRSELSTVDQLSGTGEDGLPIFDIIEELDDDGQVLKSNLKRTGLGAEYNSAFASNMEASIQNNDKKGPLSDKPKPLTEIPAPKPEGARHSVGTHNLASDDDVAGSEYEHVETSGSVPEEDIQYIEDVTTNEISGISTVSEDTSQGEYRDIDPADVLELELFEDSDDGRIDFDFDEIEEDDGPHDATHIHHSSGESSDDIPSEDDDDDDDDNDDEDDESFAFGWQGGSLFPQDEATMKLIQAHLAQQTQLSSTPDPTASSSTTEPQPLTPKKSVSTSRVHFADTVDVREFETTSSERKGVIYDRTPSRFRAARSKAITMAPRINPDSIGSKPSPKSKSVAAAAAAAAGAAAGGAHKSPSPRQGNSVSPVHGAIRERGAPAPVTSPTATRQRGAPSPQLTSVQTKYSSTATKSSPTKVAGSQHNQSQSQQRSMMGNQAARDQSKPNVQQRPKPMVSPAKIAASKGSIHHTPSSKKEIIAERAKEYYEDSFIPDVEFLRLHDTENSSPANDNHKHSATHVSSEVSDVDSRDAHQNERLNTQDRPVVSSVVLERESANEEDSADDNDDNTPDMREIKHEYQRLRQKLIYESGGFKKKDSEKAIEPIEEDGAPKKVSRFKAARVAS